MASILRKIGSTIQSQDLFGVPIQLKYENKPNFKTTLGGIASIMVRCLIIFQIV